MLMGSATIVEALCRASAGPMEQISAASSAPVSKDPGAAGREAAVMERLSALDASFLRVETRAAHMHVGWLATVDLPGGADVLPADEVRDRIAARLHHVPRFRQVVREPPGGLASPYWADAPDFDLNSHVRARAGAPPPATGVLSLAEDFFSMPLPRDRPLWELLIVPRLGARRAAVLGKVHHAMVDGVAAVQ